MHRYILFFLLAMNFFEKTPSLNASQNSFFQAKTKAPYHLSVGAVLVDEKGRIACHHFHEIQGLTNIYILMRESVENGETLLDTLQRGLLEEFGATAEPIAYLGALSGLLKDTRFSFEKTTLYILCRVVEWDPTQRDGDDPEASSTIEWHEPAFLLQVMEQQGKRFHRVDADESEMIQRALQYLDTRRG